MADNDTQTKVWAEHGWSAGYDDSGCPSLRGPEEEFGGSEMLCYWDCGGSESMEVAQRIIAAHDVTVMALTAALDREGRLQKALAGLAKGWRASEELAESEYIESRVRVSVANRTKAKCADDLDAALALAGPGQKGDSDVK